MARIINKEYIQGNLSSICQNESGQVFFLATENITVKNGEKTNIYFWLPKNHTLKHGQVACTLPPGFSLIETNRYPALKKN
jgi:hypothetical protein